MQNKLNHVSVKIRERLIDNNALLAVEFLGSFDALNSFNSLLGDSFYKILGIVSRFRLENNRVSFIIFLHFMFMSMQCRKILFQ